MSGDLSFDRDIRPLFLPFDRDAMRFAFDLWLHGDVVENATLVLERLKEGDMPCDAPWPSERIAIFETWMSNGCQA